VERRFVLFIILSFLVLTLNSFFVAPKQLPQKDQAALDAAALEQPVSDPDQAEADGATAESASAETDQATTATKDQAASDDSTNELEPRTDGPPQPAAIWPLRYITLGSIDSDSPYRMMVTLTSEGAGVRRVELSNRRYSDLQDRSGYLGHMECEADPAGGLRLRAVGPGTPAYKAGLRPGMHILALGIGSVSPVENAQQLLTILAASKPGDLVSIEYQQEGQNPEQTTATLIRRPVEVIRPESENVLLRADRRAKEKNPAKTVVQPPSFLLTLEQLDAQILSSRDELSESVVTLGDELKGIALRKSNWEVMDQTSDSVTFRTRLEGQNIEILKRYRLALVPETERANSIFPAYHLTLEIVITNQASKTQQLAYRLDGPNGLPMEGWWYANKIGRSWGATGLRDVVARCEGGDTVQFSPSEILDDDVEPLEGNPLAYIGVDAQYFSSMMLPEKSSLSDSWIAETRTIHFGPKPKKAPEKRYANVSCQLISKTSDLGPNQTLSHTYQIFAGPKKSALLAQYQASGDPRYSLSDLLYYGWFSGVAKAMLAILHFFYGLVGNYGIAIIMLTVLVRGCMFPISRKQALSMANMQKLKPEMDKLKEKYKGNTQKQSQAMQELYRKHKINPMAGCLPMVIQLPVFIGLYRSLMVDVELRQAPLISESIRWCSNLAAPDMFLDWSAWMPAFINQGQGILGLGPYLNVLPLATIALFLLQQKMFMPEAANEQAAMQQKIMKYMMIFMGFMFFKVAAGLCIYFIASSSWGIAERKLLPSMSSSGPDGPSKGDTAITSRGPEDSLKPDGNGKRAGGRANSNGQAKSKRRPKSKRKK
jgi:YidC/Oxa1 family membrane protein insertase